MDSYYADAGDAPSLADESTRGEMDELLFLLEEKDADLRRAAELGKCIENTNPPRCLRERRRHARPPRNFSLVFSL